MGQLKPDMRQRSVNNQRNLRPFQNQLSPHVCGHTAAHSRGQSKVYDWSDQVIQGVNIVSVSSLWLQCLLVMWLWVCPHEIAQLSAAERRDTRYCLVNQWNGVEIVEWHRKCLCIVSWNPKTGAPGWVYICDGNVFSPVIPAVYLTVVYLTAEAAYPPWQDWCLSLAETGLFRTPLLSGSVQYHLPIVLDQGCLSGRPLPHFLCSYCLR